MALAMAKNAAAQISEFAASIEGAGTHGMMRGIVPVVMPPNVEIGLLVHDTRRHAFAGSGQDILETATFLFSTCHHRKQAIGHPARNS